MKCYLRFSEVDFITTSHVCSSHVCSSSTHQRFQKPNPEKKKKTLAKGTVNSDPPSHTNTKQRFFVPPHDIKTEQVMGWRENRENRGGYLSLSIDLRVKFSSVCETKKEEAERNRGERNRDKIRGREEERVSEVWE